MRTGDIPGNRYDEIISRRRQRHQRQAAPPDVAVNVDPPAPWIETPWIEGGPLCVKFGSLLCVESNLAATEAPDRVGAIGLNIEAEIERLARLKLVAYERERPTAIKRLGMRAAALDTERKIVRKRLKLDDDDDDDGKPGKPLIFNEPEMWPEPVDGEALLDEIAEAIAMYVIMSELSRYAIALWVVFSYLVHLFMISPRLALRSPTHRCGKSTLIDILAHLVFRQLRCDLISGAGLTRVIAAHHPAMLIDEIDSFAAGEETLFGIIKSGHRRDHPAIKLVGDEYEPRTFDLFCALAIAFIGSVPPPLIDRSVIADLRRRKKDEKLTRFRADRTEHLDQLARKIARWAHDHAEEAATCDPEIPDEVFNRDADNWRPLIAIADIVGGKKWPQRARDAAKAGVNRGDDDTSYVEMFIADFADILDAAGDDGEPADQIASEVLAEKLHEREGRPWKEYGKAQKPISTNQIARLVKGIRDARGVPIQPVQIRVPNPNNDLDSTSEIQVRGYLRSQFQDAFERYLDTHSPDSPNQTVTTVTELAPTGTSGPFQTVTSTPPCDTSNRAGNPHGGDACDGVTLRKGESGQGVSPSLSRRQIQRLAADAKEYAYIHREDPRIAQKLRPVVDDWLTNRYGVVAADLDAEAARVLDLMYRI